MKIKRKELEKIDRELHTLLFALAIDEGTQGPGRYESSYVIPTSGPAHKTLIKVLDLLEKALDNG